MGKVFGGWYYRIQSDNDTLAIIPAYHKNKSKQFCSIQIITKDKSWNVSFSYNELIQEKQQMKIGSNAFGETELHLDIKSKNLNAVGNLNFGPLTPIKYDIMGPFRYVPFMECRHIIKSMKHTVNGNLRLNQKTYNFQNALGYIEGDRGRSFPNHYAWSQCFFPQGSLILSVADIPFCLFRFTGVIAVVMWQGREYRLATYLGAKVTHIKSGELIIKQGNWTLSAKLLEQSGKPLFAPVDGDMVRTIHEHVVCRAAYKFQINDKTVFEFETEQAAFEYEYPF